MLDKLMEALTGKRKRVIAVVPEKELFNVRELHKALVLNELNIKAALAQNHFEYLSTINAKRVTTEGDALLEESTQKFIKTERSQLLQAEYERLNRLDDEMITKLLAAHGIEYTEDINFDIATGEVFVEENVSVEGGENG